MTTEYNMVYPGNNPETEKGHYVKIKEIQMNYELYMVIIYTITSSIVTNISY